MERGLGKYQGYAQALDLQGLPLPGHASRTTSLGRTPSFGMLFTHIGDNHNGICELGVAAAMTLLPVEEVAIDTVEGSTVTPPLLPDDCHLFQRSRTDAYCF